MDPPVEPVYRLEVGPNHRLRVQLARPGAGQDLGCRQPGELLSAQ